MASPQRGTWLSKAPAPELPGGFALSEVDDLVPLDAQLGVDAPKCVPDALAPLLFDDAATGAEAKTYAILDAAKLSLVPDILETSGSEHACLFQGAAATDMRDLSPWLVALGCDDRVTRALMTDVKGPRGLWRHDLGVFIRTAAPFDQVWRHLRRFVRLRHAETGEWLYFRFWERHVPLGLARAAAPEPQELVQRLLAPIDGAPQAWVMVDPKGRAASCLALRDPSPERVAVPLLHPATLDALAASTTDARMRDEIHAALGRVPDSVRTAYGTEPRLAELWQALHEARFTERDQRIDAMCGYLTLVFARRQDEAWRILTETTQGPTIRLWHLDRALETAA